MARPAQQISGNLGLACAIRRRLSRVHGSGVAPLDHFPHLLAARDRIVAVLQQLGFGGELAVLDFSVLDRAPTGVLVIGVTNSGGATVSEFMGPLNGQNPLFTRSGTVTLEQGQFLAFIVNPGASYSNDSTGLNFTLTSSAAPEPATWAMIILGFGVVGARARRKAVHA